MLLPAGISRINSREAMRGMCHMKWFCNIIQSMVYDLEVALKAIRYKFTSFLTILVKNNQVLKVTSDMVELFFIQHVMNLL